MEKAICDTINGIETGKCEECPFWKDGDCVRNVNNEEDELMFTREDY